MNQVYVSMSARPRRRDDNREREVSGLDSDPRPLQEVFEQRKNRLMVLKGRAGSGKTTFVNHLIWQRVEQPKELPERWHRLTVIPLRLRHLVWDRNARTEHPIWQAVRASLSIDRQFEQSRDDLVKALQERIKRKGGIVLLDGLDELPGGDRQLDAFLQELEGFVDDMLHPDCGYLLLTTRSHAFDETGYQLPGFVAAELAPFSPAQQNEFLHNWSRALGLRKRWKKPERRVWLDDLIDAFERQPHLRELGQRPLWLALIATLQTYRKTLPEEKVVLFDELIELMLHRWPSWRIEQSEGLDERVVGRFLNAREFRSALEAMAYELHERGGLDQERAEKTVFLTKNDLIGRLATKLSGVHGVSSEEYLDYLSEGAALPEMDVQHRYRFVVTSFQEFLAAGHLADRDDFNKKLTTHLQDNAAHWGEVAEHLLGIIHLRHPRFGLLAALNLLLPQMPPSSHEQQVLSHIPVVTWRIALHCARALLDLRLEDEKHEQLREQLATVRDRLRQWLTRWVECGSLSAQERAEAGDVLARLGDSRFHGAEKLCLPRLYRGGKETSLGFMKGSGRPFPDGLEQGR